MISGAVPSQLDSDVTVPSQRQHKPSFPPFVPSLTRTGAAAMSPASRVRTRLIVLARRFWDPT